MAECTTFFYFYFLSFYSYDIFKLWLVAKISLSRITLCWIFDQARHVKKAHRDDLHTTHQHQHQKTPGTAVTYEWDAVGGRHALSHHQLEDGERQQHRHPKGHLLPRVGRQVEAQRGQEGDHHAGDEQVEDVEGGAPLEVQRVGDVRVGFRAAAVQDHVLLGRHAEHLEQEEEAGCREKIIVVICV